MKNTLRKLWNSNPALTLVGLIMILGLVQSAVGLGLDRRLITNAPAWLKPAKFDISTAIYSFTLAWILSYVSIWPKLVRSLANLIAIILFVEVALIHVQAARGTTSHFNLRTPLDAAIYQTMGISIGALWLVSIVLTIAIFRQTFTEPVLGWSLRLGMLLTVLGTSVGGMMTAPSSAQLAAAQQGQPLTIVGSHTVGAPDGGPSMPGTGWSRDHRDLRIAHFFGLHALQILPWIGWWLSGSRRPSLEGRKLQMLGVAAASYCAFFFLLVWQASRGQSILMPDATTLFSLAAWAGATALAMMVTFIGDHRLRVQQLV